MTEATTPSTGVVTAELVERFEGTKLKAALLEAHRKTVLEAAVGYRTGVTVAIKGVIERDRADRPKRFESVEHVTSLDPLDIETRLEELAQLQDGWLDGKGRAPDRASLVRLAQAFDERFSTDLPLPHLYPTPEGGVQAEWTLGSWEVSLEITLPNLASEYQAVHTVTGETREHALLLAAEDGSGWAALNEVLAELQEAKA